jgi:hypothetical protein
MDRWEPEYDEHGGYVLKPGEAKLWMRQLLEDAELTFEELQEQARRGWFDTPEADDAWFVISAFLECTDVGPP